MGKKKKLFKRQLLIAQKAALTLQPAAVPKAKVVVEEKPQTKVKARLTQAKVKAKKSSKKRTYKKRSSKK